MWRNVQKLKGPNVNFTYTWSLATLSWLGSPVNKTNLSRCTRVCARLIAPSFMLGPSAPLLPRNGLLSQLILLMPSADKDGRNISQPVKCILVHNMCQTEWSAWCVASTKQSMHTRAAKRSSTTGIRNARVKATQSSKRFCIGFGRSVTLPLL